MRRGNESELSSLFNEVGYLENTHPALILVNKYTSLGSLLSYTVGELEELVDEHESILHKNDGEKFKPNKRWMMEFADLIVMLKVVSNKIGQSRPLSESRFSVNGQFKGDFHHLQEQLLNLSEGDPSKNLDYLFVTLLSLLKFLDIGIQGEILGHTTQSKLLANRESRFFQLEANMTFEDVLAKNNHTFTALRLIRNFLQDVTGEETLLQSWITDFFAEDILNWRNSAVSLESIKMRIVDFQTKIQDELSWILTTSASPVDPNLQLKMQIAGAKLVGKRQGNAALQFPSNSATLGGTVFWT